jgi:hypothetical protein
MADAAAYALIKHPYALPPAPVLDTTSTSAAIEST